MHTKRKATISFIYDAAVEAHRKDKTIFATQDEWDCYIMDTMVEVIQDAIKDNSIFGIIRISDIEVD
jgi:ribosome-binding factor A